MENKLYKDGMLIEHVNITNKKIYYNLCKIAVKQNSYSFLVLDTGVLNFKQYSKLFKISIKNQSFILKYIKLNKYYFETCKIALQFNGLFLQCIDYRNIEQNKYIELCKIACHQNLNSLKFTNNKIKFIDLFNKIKNKYFDVCPICLENQLYYVVYTCSNKHYICINCLEKCDTCYYRCKSKINFNIIYKYMPNFIE